MTWGGSEIALEANASGFYKTRRGPTPSLEIVCRPSEPIASAGQ